MPSWVGHLIGPAALAAVSTAGFYVWVLLSLGEMVEVGLIAVAARPPRRGASRMPPPAPPAARWRSSMALRGRHVVSLLGFALTDTLFQVMTRAARRSATLGRAYLDTWLLGGPLVFGFFADGDVPRLGRHAHSLPPKLMASVVLSVGLDPLLISGVGPFPTLGVEGAALASVMVRGGGFLIGNRDRLAARPDPPRRPPTGHAVPTVLRVARRSRSPAAALGGVHVAHAVHLRFGTAALAALGVGHKVEGLGSSHFRICALGFGPRGAEPGRAAGGRAPARPSGMTVSYCLAVTSATASPFSRSRRRSSPCSLRMPRSSRTAVSTSG